MELIDRIPICEMLFGKMSELTKFCGGYRYLDHDQKAEYDELERMDEILRNAPVVEYDHTLVHGCWLPVDEKEDAFDCSECYAMVQRRYNFCPKCGAKMDLK